MNFPQRLLLLSLAAVPFGTSAIANAQPGRYAPAQPPGNDWWTQWTQILSNDALIIGKKIAICLLIFIAGWLLAKIISYLVYRGLCRTNLDNRLANSLRLGVLMEGQGKPPQPHQLERGIAKAFYWVLMLLVVVGVLQQAGLSQTAGPIQGFVDTIIQALPLVAKAGLILVIAYFAGLLLSRLLVGALTRIRVDNRFAELSAQDAKEPPKPFSRAAGDIVFWLVMVAGLAGAFDALRITPLAQPLNLAMTRIIGVIPSFGFAALILIAGYVLARIVRVIVHNLLDSLGFNRLIDRLGVARVFGTTKPSAVVGMIAAAFILFQAGIAALNEVGLVTLSAPLTAMMSRFWLVLPDVAVSVLTVILGVFLGRIVRGPVAATLRNLGFDRLAHRLGFPVLAARTDRLGEPSELVGFVVQAAIILLATAQACENLQLHTWAAYLNLFLGYLLRHVLVAVAIVGVGVAVGNYVRDLVRARGTAPQNGRQNQWLAEFARYAVLVFTFTMALQQLQVAPDFVLLAFGLLFGGLCLAMALAFGLGGREVAGEMVRRGVDQAKAGNLPPSPGPGPGPDSPGSSGGFPRMPLR